MKKLFLSLAVIASMAMVSCGNKAAEATEEAPVEEAVVEEGAAEVTEEAPDSVPAETAETPAAEEAPAEIPA